MRKTLATAALMVTLCCASLAGEMHTPGAPAPPPEPPPASVMQEPTNDAAVNGEIPTPGVSDILAETALDLLAVLPALL